MTASETDKLVLALLTIQHPNITTRRYVNDTADIVSNGDTYSAFPFSVVLPSDTESEASSIEVVLSNVTLEATEDARLIAGSGIRATADLVLVDYDNPDTELLSFKGYEIPSMPYDKATATFRMVVETFLYTPFPDATYTPGTTPGIM